MTDHRDRGRMCNGQTVNEEEDKNGDETGIHPRAQTERDREKKTETRVVCFVWSMDGPREN